MKKDKRTINEYHDQSGMTVRDLSAFLGVSARTYANMQNGSRKLTACERLGLSALVGLITKAQ